MEPCCFPSGPIILICFDGVAGEQVPIRSHPQRCQAIEGDMIDFHMVAFLADVNKLLLGWLCTTSNRGTAR